MSDDALVDTNILTTLRDVQHVRHASTDEAINAMRGTCVLRLAPQSLYEFWTVATRPMSVNGLGWTVEHVATDIALLRKTFTVLPDPPKLLDEWLDLCRTHGVSGKPAHDARLAAYARLHGIGKLVTLNARDFKRYGLDVVVL